MLTELNKEERLRLVRFVCSFAWADLHVSTEERLYVGRLVARLKLSAEERLRVEEWLKRPPAPDDIDPNSIPRRHRELFLDAIRGLVAVDLDISQEERDSLSLLEQLVR